ncbi:hypothetical protein [Phenylobacterium koreense]|uniref:Uncharacterized protein n=1 Tax=Phenylobacterium koreense TaxID=266125 RepID=A0ABV2EGK7_9CAUL
MNALTDTAATEITQIYGSLDGLFDAIIELDARPRRRPLARIMNAAELIDSAYAELSMTEPQRFASRLSCDPVREALCYAVRQLGRRLHEIGGMRAMHDAMVHIEEIAPDDGGRRVSRHSDEVLRRLFIHRTSDEWRRVK